MPRLRLPGTPVIPGGVDLVLDDSWSPGNLRLRVFPAADVERLVQVHSDVEIGPTFRGGAPAKERLPGALVPAMFGGREEPQVQPGWEVLMFLAKLGYQSVPVHCDAAAERWLAGYTPVSPALPSGWEIH